MKRIPSNLLPMISGLTIAVVAFVTYLPALQIGFLDGWWYLEWAAKFPFVRYLIQFFDPVNITQGYRPVQGLYMYLLFRLFGFNPDGFHYAHNLLHAANAVLLFLIVRKIGKVWRVAFVAALIYAVLPNYCIAVFWHAAVDPLSGFFYLLTILLWTRFLDTQYAHNYALAFLAFVFALFSKEIAIFLPLFLFLIEWWFYRVKPNLRVDLPRYLPFFITFIPYLWLVYQVQSHGEFAGQFGFRIGPDMLGNLIPYLAMLAFPWQSGRPTEAIYWVWLAITALAYLVVMVYKRSKVLLFLALTAGLNISPLLGFPLDYFHPRYLYLSTITSAITLALVFEIMWQLADARKVLAGIVALAVVGVVSISSTQVADSAAGLAEYTRQLRVPYRDIVRQRPTFPDDSYVYFVYSPKTPLADFQGLFMTRYGLGLPVSGTEDATPPGLRKHQNTFVYYFDEANRPREIVVDTRAITHISSALPVNFDAPIRLESVEVINPTVTRAEPLLLILYWRAIGTLGQNYTVFVHLTDANGNALAQYDTPPRRGDAPTSQWKLNQPVVDAHILPVLEIPADEYYRVEIGLYHQPTMQRLNVVDAQGHVVADKIVIEPIAIE
jgi:hypothetical protein